MLRPSALALLFTLASQQTVAQTPPPPPGPSGPPLPKPLPIEAPPPKLVPAVNETQVDAYALSENPRGQPQFNVGFGYIHSKWSRFNPKLKDGSLSMIIGLQREFVPGFEGGISATAIQSAQGAAQAENLSGGHISVDARLLPFDGRVRPYLGASLAFGSYRAWTLQSETPSQITYTKHSSGALIGVIPELGTRFELGPRMAVDIVVGYHGYFNNPDWRIGGWAAGARIGLRR